MSTKDEVREFLVSRRANVTPQQAGMPDFGGERRVPGLRREEVAMLAGVSLDYYTRLERGNIRGASESVLNAIARALQLNDVEREYLFDLARTAPRHRCRARRQARAQRCAPRCSGCWTTSPCPRSCTTPARTSSPRTSWAGPCSRRTSTPTQPNMARFIFLDPRARDYYVDWALARSMTAAMLRLEAGRDPLNSELTALIGELSTRSPQFREDWAGHDVHEHRTGVKVYRHPEVGAIDVTFDVFEMPGEPGLSIVTYTADEGTDPPTSSPCSPAGRRPTPLRAKEYLRAFETMSVRRVAARGHPSASSAAAEER